MYITCCSSLEPSHLTYPESFNRGWMVAAARVGKVRVLISRLWMSLDKVLARKIKDPALDLSDNEVVRIVNTLVEFGELA